MSPEVYTEVKILGSGLLGYKAMQFYKWSLTFWKNLIPSPSGQKMETTGSSKMLVTTYKSA
jgi:hypothetical protein